jgi:hypothetical protein
MSSTRRPRQSGILAFWELLSSLERTTQLEAQAIEERDFHSMKTLHEAKRSGLDRLVLLGRRLGLDRSNPELDARLKGLARAEARNADMARRAAESLREELRKMNGDSRKLKNFRQAYVGEPSEPDFTAEG